MDAVSAGLRSYRLYAGQGPMLERFLETARANILPHWEVLPRVKLEKGGLVVVHHRDGQVVATEVHGVQS